MVWCTGYAMRNIVPRILFWSVQANMRVKIRGADDFLDVGQPVDYAKLMTQVIGLFSGPIT